jgi:hypothetical protein
MLQDPQTDYGSPLAGAEIRRFTASAISMWLKHLPRYSMEIQRLAKTASWVQSARARYAVIVHFVHERSHDHEAVLYIDDGEGARIPCLIENDPVVGVWRAGSLITAPGSSQRACT